MESLSILLTEVHPWPSSVQYKIDTQYLYSVNGGKKEEGKEKHSQEDGRDNDIKMGNRQLWLAGQCPFPLHFSNWAAFKKEASVQILRDKDQSLSKKATKTRSLK